jgi:23S rRNA pseudouridine2605 synthase
MREQVRLQKLLARAGVASRRAAEDLIRDGKVRVNGQVVTVMGTTVDPELDVVTVDGKTIRTAPPVWIALHKPAGYVTTRGDPRGRRTVYDLLPPEHRRLLHVGRLDVESEGLLLLTNDGDGAHRLLHPRFGIQRVYDLTVEGTVGTEALKRLVSGVDLDDGVARVVGVRRLRSKRSDRSRLQVVLREGRNREVRRMMEAVGHPVTRLRRMAYGPVQLGTLPRGSWRPLTDEERRRVETPSESGDR